MVFLMTNTWRSKLVEHTKNWIKTLIWRVCDLLVMLNKHDKQHIRKTGNQPQSEKLTAAHQCVKKQHWCPTKMSLCQAEVINVKPHTITSPPLSVVEVPLLHIVCCLPHKTIHHTRQMIQHEEDRHKCLWPECIQMSDPHKKQLP